MQERLTVVAHGDAAIHGITDKRHNDAEKCQENPVLAEPCASVLPGEGQQSQQLSAKRAAPGFAQVLSPRLIIFPPPFLVILKPTRLFLRVLTQVPRVATIHLKTADFTLLRSRSFINSRTDERRRVFVRSNF